MQTIETSRQGDETPKSWADCDRIVRELLSDTRLWTPPTANLNPHLLDEEGFFSQIREIRTRLQPVVGYGKPNVHADAPESPTDRIAWRQALLEKNKAAVLTEIAVQALGKITPTTWRKRETPPYEKLRAATNTLVRVREYLGELSQDFARTTSSERGRARFEGSVLDAVSEAERNLSDAIGTIRGRVATSVRGLFAPKPKRGRPKVSLGPDGRPNLQVIRWDLSDTPEEPK